MPVQVDDVQTSVGRALTPAEAAQAEMWIADAPFLLSRGPDGRTPIILDDLELPTQTKLLPEADEDIVDVCRHACGVRRVLPFLGKPIGAESLIAMVAGYRRALGLCDKNAPAIASIFESLPGLTEAPIRVLLRGTDEYVRASTQDVWPPLLDAEEEQLARGDIPYFFRFYGRRGIHHYAERTLRIVHRLPLRGDVPQLEPLLSLGKGLRDPSRTTLREQGLLLVLGAFDHPSFTGRHHDSGLEVVLGARSIVVTLPSGETLRCARNLRAHVGSVYLPCRCGEVRSVFVPATTVCRASAGVRDAPAVRRTR